MGWRSGMPRFNARIVLTDPSDQSPLRRGILQSITMHKDSTDVHLLWEPGGELLPWLEEMHKSGKTLAMLRTVADGETLLTSMRHVQVTQVWFEADALITHGATLTDITA